MTIKNAVRTALQNLPAEVIYGVPGDFCSLPRVVWRESQNRCYRQADAREYLSELNYTLDIFDASPEAASELADAADAALAAIRLRRELRAEISERETNIHHISARYRALADADGTIYQ